MPYFTYVIKSCREAVPFAPQRIVLSLCVNTVMVIYIVGLKLYVSSVLPQGVCDGFLSSSPRPFSRSTDVQTAQPDELTAPCNYERMDKVISSEIAAKVTTFVLAHRLKRV